MEYFIFCAMKRESACKFHFQSADENIWTMCKIRCSFVFGGVYPDKQNQVQQ